MPRSARLDAPGVLHHVMGRGIEGKEIFLGDVDRDDFISRLAKLVEDDAMDIYAWALLPNHFHLLCKTNKRPLSSSMRKLLTGYVVNFNMRHKRHGRSPWSGHSGLMGYVKRPWQDTGYILSFFGKGRGRKKNYLNFLEQGIALGSRPELVGGGLVRSLGGWAEVMGLRRRTERQLSDQRILGDGDFVETVLTEMDNVGKENLRLGAKRTDLSLLAKKVCNLHKVSVGEIRSGSRRHEIVEARRVFSWLAVKELGYSGAEVARYLGVTTSCVTRTISEGNGFDREDYI